MDKTKMMTLKFRKSRLLVPALLATSIGLLGCGGSSNDKDNNTPPPSSAGITVLPERFNFGLITEGNSAKPRQFTLSNEGDTPYTISNMSLVGFNPAEFVLDENGGDAPCAARALSLAPGESCTVEVSFNPRSFDEFSAALLVRSNDPNASSVARALSGTYAKVESVNVTVNQVNACPRSAPAKAFVSVLDQAGFPIRGLDSGDFTLEEGGVLVSNPDARPVADNANIALSIVIDNSCSITRFPSAVDNMEEAATLLVEAMRANDEADIIKYANEVKEMLPGGFTSDPAVLKAAIAEDPGLSCGTAFYDATVKAIERLQTRATDRKVVINLTDGEDTRSVNAGLADTVNDALATNIPIFTVGFGDINPAVLQEMADDTGGVFYNPAADANLQQIADQVTALLFNDQYVITFDSALADDQSASLVVTTEFIKDGTPFAGEGSRTMLACP